VTAWNNKTIHLFSDRSRAVGQRCLFLDSLSNSTAAIPIACALMLCS